ncbi:MAG: prepilin peptidase [Caulobacteraceae bacterium]|nr:prepilin peptidase [Caulobacteraceae bacterium]
MNDLQAALLTVFPALVIIAAMTDAVSFTIPNRISLLLLAVYVPVCLLLDRPVAEIGVEAAVGLAALLLGMGMFAAGWIGGGDAKLFAVSALWLGWAGLPVFLLVTALAGGVLAVLLLNARSAAMKPYFRGAPAWFARLVTPGAGVPYGVAIAAGALTAFPRCALMSAFHGHF